MTGSEMANMLYDKINEEFERDCSSGTYISRDTIQVYEKIKRLILINIAVEKKNEEEGTKIKGS